MNCPNCGKEMERGKIITSHSRGLFFLPPGGDIDALLFLTKKYITRQNGIVLDGPSPMNPAFPPAFAGTAARSR